MIIINYIKSLKYRKYKVKRTEYEGAFLKLNEVSTKEKIKKIKR